MKATDGRVLVYRSGALGDVLCTLPAIEFARRRFAECGAGLALAAPAALIPLLRRCEPNTQLIASESAQWASLFVSPPQFEPRLSEYRYALVFAVDAAVEAQLCASRVEAALIAGRPAPFDPGRNARSQRVDCQYARFVCEALQRFKISKETDIQDALQLCETFVLRIQNGNGVKTAGVDSDLPPLAVFAVGAGSRDRRLPAQWLLSGARLWRQLGGRCVFSSGPADDEALRLLRAESAAEELPGPVFSGDLEQLALLLCGAALCTGADSGVLHLAAALGRPNLSVFTNSDVRIWAPRGVWSRQIAEDPDCCEEKSAMELWSNAIVGYYGAIKHS
ncbi:MAG: hypothetical protein K1X75_11795 [Leptospirales bacterium]|nr:hypothetical protein [Leptospirales bacterium]